MAAFGGDGNTPAVVPQEVLGRYITHRAAVDLVAPYQNSGRLAAAAGKPFIMFETNTASCGGFPGISDSFTAALWGVDYGMQMAWANFTHGMLHVGGQNVVYNVSPLFFSFFQGVCTDSLGSSCSPLQLLQPTSLLSINGLSGLSIILPSCWLRRSARPIRPELSIFGVMQAMCIPLRMRSTRVVFSTRSRCSTS